MGPPDNPTAWHEVIVGALGNLLGGFAATLLWWCCSSWLDRRRRLAARAQKRNAIALETAKIRGWLRLIIQDPDRASAGLPDRSSQVLSALVRLGPDLGQGRSLEPSLAILEHRLGMVEAAAMRLFVSTAGVAAALRGNDDDLDQLKEALPREAEKALAALGDFERSAVA